jgi:hypothetical protein
LEIEENSMIKTTTGLNADVAKSDDREKAAENIPETILPGHTD